MISEASVRITNCTGLHARPAVKFAQLAAAFKANVQVRAGCAGEWVKARSTSKIMKLKATRDTTLYLKAEGEEACDAVAALIALVERDFDEAAAHADPAEQSDAVTTMAPAGEVAGPGEIEATRVVRGEVVAPGLAAGRLYTLDEVAAPIPSLRGEDARAALARAIALARSQLGALAAASDCLASEIIGFQLALLTEDDLLGGAFDAIANGATAEAAWRSTIDEEIAGYERAEEPRLRARAADLRDVQSRVLDALSERLRAAPALRMPGGAIVLAKELTPSRFLALDEKRLAGLVTEVGSATSHVAMLARARGLPALANLDAELGRALSGTHVLLDAERGLLVIEPQPAARVRFEKRLEAETQARRDAATYLSRAVKTASGESVSMLLNVDDPAVLQGVAPAHCDGIGLTRTEFLLRGAAALPDEETQFRAYSDLLAWAEGRAVTIRTLDAGGDKPLPGLTANSEANPFLGVRGVRLSLAHPEVFKVQLRALARAAARGPLKVMVPMVTVPAELDAVRALLEAEVGALAAGGFDAAMPHLGMMVEVPAAALCIAEFNTDFISIGSNDLAQYVMAAGRDCQAVAHLLRGAQPAVMALVARVVEYGAASGIEVSVCGEMAAEPDGARALVACGVRALSVPAGALGVIKRALIAREVQG